MGKSKELRTLMWVVGLQTAPEYRNLNDIFSIYMQKDLGWSLDQASDIFVFDCLCVLARSRARVRVLDIS
jgi:hypothetical protein